MPVIGYGSLNQKKLSSVKEISGHGMHHNHARGLRAEQRKPGCTRRQRQRLVWRHHNIQVCRRSCLLNPRAISSTDAMCYWPETATAVAVRLREDDTCEIAAPLGLEDLFDLVIRPAGRFGSEKTAIYQDCFKSKGWLKAWPMLKLAISDRKSVV